MALGTGKTTAIATVNANRTTFISDCINADNSLASLTSPANNLSARQSRYGAIFDAMVNDIVSSLFDAIMTEIKTNGVVNFPIAVQVSPATGTGATTAPGTIS